MKKDTAWYSKRRESSLTLAYYYYCKGEDWTSLREVVGVIADELSIPRIGRRRSDIAMECHDRLIALGFAAPAQFVPPWAVGNQYGRMSRKSLDRYSEFYETAAWRRLRFETIVQRGRKCECCGAEPPAVVIHVDHIRSIKRYWHLRLDPKNLQVLCENCNMGKGSIKETDFRQGGCRPHLMSADPF